MAAAIVWILERNLAKSEPSSWYLALASAENLAKIAPRTWQKNAPKPHVNN